MSVLFDEISSDLELNLVQVGWIWGFYPMSGLFTIFIAGLLADRFGARRILIIVCTLIGLAGASRGLATDFIGLLFTTLLFGLLAGLIPANIVKVAATWFPPQKLGLASGIIATGMGVGFTIGSMFSATLLSPLLGGWRRVLFLYGAISVFFAFLWFITVKEQKSAGVAETRGRGTTRKVIYNLLRNKNLWLISFTMLGYTGCILGMTGYLPIYLRDFKEWLPASADGTLAAFTGFSTLGAIPISLLSDRIGRRKIFVLPIITAAIIGVGLLSVADGLIIWVLIILVGIGRDGLIALGLTSCIESEGIGALYSGTAMGILQTIGQVGGFISPPIGNSMATIGSGLPFIVWAAFGVFALVCYSLTRETGRQQIY
jgi:predicted MFS family arabinose efflux permease